jgi:hypothetical protein
MVKTHIVQLTIVNKTKFSFGYLQEWFDCGRIADGNSWPRNINAGTIATITCYEKDYSVGVGCSGWVKYSINNAHFYLCFSNPSVGANLIGIGENNSEWKKMTEHYIPVDIANKLEGNISITTTISSTPGITNNATWIIRES